MGRDSKGRRKDEHRNEVARRKGAEVALGKSQEMFHLVIDAVTDYAILALDPEGNVLTWNAGAERIKGYQASEIIGTHFSRFYTPEDILRQHPQYELRQAVLHGSYKEEGWRVRKDGKRFWANVVITAIRDETGKVIGFSKVTRDLTERKLVEDQLHEAYVRLEQRVKERTAELAKSKELAETAVRSRDEFLSIASHELKTPLTTLKLQMQIRKRQIGKGDLSAFTSDRLKAMISDDEKQVNRLNRLVDDMLDITRLTAGKLTLELEKADLRTLVQDVLARFAPQLEAAGVTVHLDAPAEVVGEWDPYRIEQVFTNLVTNAMKYGAAKPVSISVSREGDQAKLVVRDQGIGIAKEDQARLFQQFERAVSAAAFSGLGLGLYIVRQIVEGHGGTISVKSEPGRGAEFTVLLPLHGV